MATRLIGVAGPSGAGKSYFAHRLADALGASVLSLDHYYRDLGSMSFEDRCRVNFDDPASIDSPLLLQHARALVLGEPVQVPRYDFATHSRAPGGDSLLPGPFLVLEGLFTLYWPELRALLTDSFFIELDDEACYSRRLERDTKERGRTPSSIEEQYRNTVRPMAELHILPTRAFAGHIIRGDADLDSVLPPIVSELLAPAAIAGGSARP